MSSRSAVFATRLHRVIQENPQSEGNDAALCCLLLLGIDIAINGRVAELERAQELLRLMDPRNGG
jgi:hypothetical protein